MEMDLSRKILGVPLKLAETNQGWLGQIQEQSHHTILLADAPSISVRSYVRCTNQLKPARAMREATGEILMFFGF
jgi:hypothetical protein